MYALVAIPRSAPEPLVYRVPAELESTVRRGVRVRVPVRTRTLPGMVVGISDTTEIDPSVIRDVGEVLDLEPLLPPVLLDLADFVSGYYRCPLGDTLASMLPSPLLRSDVETARLTPRGAATAATALGPPRDELLSLLQERGRLPVATLLARVAGAGRGSLEALVDAGLVRLNRQRRDRPPQVEVAAVQLADAPLDRLLEECARAPRQLEVLRWLAEVGRPALAREVTAATGASASTLRAMAGRGVLHRFTQLPARRSRWSLRSEETRHELTDEQQVAVNAILDAIGTGGFRPLLLEGVTGSGKTEVYLRCLEAVLAAGRSGLVLVPEIGLTPATAGAVERRFGSRAAVMHSAQSDGERYRQWVAVRDGEARVVVGPRSALFAPFPDLGLVVVDEEHDGAYKQQEAPRYHARDLALVLAQRLGIPALLCSATPSAEAAALVQRDKAERYRLTRRVAGGSLPEVELVDLRAEPPEPGEHGRTLFSRRLLEALGTTLDRGEQAILLIQRRGWAPILLCRECGHRVDCPSCSVSMVVHRRSGDLRCHYCSRRSAVPESCPSCSGALLDAVGAGTEKVAHHLGRLLPDVRVSILDRDTVRRRDGLESSLGAFASGRTQVLVGTQMVAKGHHFPNVTLTGVISADALLGLPDFRAGERTFQLLTQVAGRAGRGERPGRVVIQTYYPDHPAVRHAVGHDVTSFLAEELAFRRAFAYPPVARMALVRMESRGASSARRAAEAAARAIDPLPAGVRLRGPSPAPLERLRGSWRWQLLLSAPRRDLLRQLMERVESAEVPPDVRRVIDVDPLSTL